ncbi:MAG: LLM class flavin-dependent oxidoreductase, partial [Chloroflexota bacterium]
NNAGLQLRPFTQPHMPVAVASMQSPAGPLLAGKHGAGLLSMGLFMGLRGAVDLKAQWGVLEEAAAKAGRAAHREDWRLVMNVHLAETRAEAIRQIREPAVRWLSHYQRDVLGRALPEGVPESRAVDAIVDSGSWIVGTPDDCIAAIDQLDEASGGFGGLMVMAQDWATREDQRRSYELLAREVMPRYKGQLPGVEAAYARAVAHSAQSQGLVRDAIAKAFEAHEGQR